MLDAVAAAAEVPAATVRRAFMLSGRLPATARARAPGGPTALDAVRLRGGRPVRPMLASPARRWTPRWPTSAPTSPWSTSSTGPGSRCTGTATRSACGPARCARSPAASPSSSRWSRAAVPHRGPGRRDPRGRRRRPAPRVPGHDEPLRQRRGRRPGVLSPFFFDLLAPRRPRPARRAAAAASTRCRLLAADGTPAADARRPPPDRRAGRRGARRRAGRRARGRRGQGAGRAYAAGRRGKAWQKVKPVHTLDLVVLGAEWGYGRRTG